MEKRPITDIEFEDLKEAIHKMYNPDTVPVFNPEWEKFTQEQRREIEDIMRWGKGSKDYFSKYNDLYNKAIKCYPAS